MRRRFTGLGPVLVALVLLLSPSLGAAEGFAVNPRPPVPIRDPRFGIVQAIHSPDWAVAAGASWERIIFPWSRIEPRPGAFEKGYFSDQQIEDQVARGFTEVGVIIYTPDWAAPDPKLPHPKRVPRNLYRAWDDPENYWGRFTGKLAAHYAGLVDHWVIWNEPDLYDPTGRWFFDGTFEDYYQLLKVAYQSIKTHNPRATVILAGMAYWYDKWYDRPPYLASLLEVAARDPSARRNNWYFDAVSVHTYANPLNAYTQPMQMQRILDQRGIRKPVWIMESNAVPGDDPKAPTKQPGAYRASQDEQASYVIQSYALAIAAGVERQSIYKMLDETAEDGQFFGLLRNDWSIRPAYVAYQTAATYLSGARWASYDWSGGNTPPTDEEVDAVLASIQGRSQWIWPGQVNRVVVERGNLRTTVVWNASPQRVRARVPAAARSALAVTQYGDAGELVAGDGFYTLDLDPTAHNTDPTDRSIYLIGGRPWILEEQVHPLPLAVRSRIEMVWPHNSAPTTEASHVNVTVQLLDGEGSEPVPCRWEPRVFLRGSVERGPDEVLGMGRKSIVERDGIRYPVWQFNNVPVAAARAGKFITFSAAVERMPMTHEYWVYGGPPDPPPSNGSGGAAPQAQGDQAGPMRANPLQPADPPPVSCR